MIINRNNLLLTGIGTTTDKKLAALGNIHITEDGDSVAGNGKTIIIVQGVDEQRKDNIPFEGRGKALNRAVSLPIEFAETIVKGIPKDKQFDGLLELVRLEETKKKGVVQAISHNGKGEQVAKRHEYTRKFVDFVSIFKTFVAGKKKKAKFVLDRQRLIKTLQTMDKLCGEAPCYIEVTEDDNLFIRSVIPSTGQRVMALMTNVLGEWLPESDFEAKYLGSGKSKKKRPLKRRKSNVKRKRKTDSGD